MEVTILNGVFSMFISRRQLFSLFLLVPTIICADQNTKRTAVYEVIRKVELSHGPIIEVIQLLQKNDTNADQTKLKTLIKNFPIHMKLEGSKVRDFQIFPYAHYVELLEQQLKRLRKKQITVGNMNKRAKGSLKRARTEKERELYKKDVDANKTLETTLRTLCDTLTTSLEYICAQEFYLDEMKFYVISSQNQTLNKFAKFSLFGPLGLLF